MAPFGRSTLIFPVAIRIKQQKQTVDGTLLLSIHVQRETKRLEGENVSGKAEKEAQLCGKIEKFCPVREKKTRRLGEFTQAVRRGQRRHLSGTAVEIELAEQQQPR